MEDLAHPDLRAAADPRQQLESIAQIGDPHERHHRLVLLVHKHPSFALGHIQLGFSFLINRFQTALGLPVLIFGGPDHATRHEFKEHIDRAEMHFQRALVLDPSLHDSATVNIAGVKLFRHRYGPAIVYIEELLRNPNHTFASLLKSYLGIAYREMGEYDVALSVFQSLLDSNLQFIHRHLAFTHLCQDNLPEARSELEVQTRVSHYSIDQLLLDALNAELQNDVSSAVKLYEGVARHCKYDAIQEFAGINAARRAAKLQRDEGWKLTDYCDQLAY